MWQKIFKILKFSITTVSVLLIIILWTGISYYLISSAFKSSSGVASNDSVDTSDTSTSSETENCNVYGINIHGTIVTYHGNDAYNDQDKLIFDETSSDEVIGSVNNAEDNPNIKGIIVEIDSSGGSPVAGEEMMQAFKNSKKPVVAYIRSMGDSAAYLAATGAQTIFASDFSDVGSIGVTMSYLQNVNKNNKDGLTYVSLSSGPYKDTGSPDKPLTQAEKNLLMRDVNIIYNDFVNIVAQNRNLPVEKVKALADGSTVLGETALKDGLIDKIGSYYDAKDFLSEKIGVPVTICWQN